MIDGNGKWGREGEEQRGQDTQAGTSEPGQSRETGTRDGVTAAGYGRGIVREGAYSQMEV